MIENGGIPYELSDEKIYTVITKKQQSFEQLELFGDAIGMVGEQKLCEAEEMEFREQKNDIYNMVKMFLVEYVGKGKSLEEVSGNFDIVSSQMKIWLEHLCKDKLLVFEQGIYRRR